MTLSRATVCFVIVGNWIQIELIPGYFTQTILMMSDDLLEDSHIDDKERMKLNSYNINKEKGIGTLENFRWMPVLSVVMRFLFQQEA